MITDAMVGKKKVLTTADVLNEARELQRYCLKEHKPYSADVVGDCIATIEHLTAALADVGGWREIATFPEDGDGYLAIDNRISDGFPQVVFWDEGRLHVPDAEISYAQGFFTHWMPLPPLPAPPATNAGKGT